VSKAAAGSCHHHLLPNRRLLAFEIGDGLLGFGKLNFALGQLPFVLLGRGRRDLDLLRAGFLAFAALAFVLVVMAVFFVPMVFSVAVCLSLFIWGSCFGVATIAMPLRDSYLGSKRSPSGSRAELRIWPKIREWWVVIPQSTFRPAPRSVRLA
jgi:hypothetical protein